MPQQADQSVSDDVQMSDANKSADEAGGPVTGELTRQRFSTRSALLMFKRVDEPFRTSLDAGEVSSSENEEMASSDGESETKARQTRFVSQG